MLRDLLTIRGNKADDSAEIYLTYVSAIRAQCSHHYTQEDIEKMIAAKNSKFYSLLDTRYKVLVGEINGHIVGFGAVDTVENYIVNLFISHKNQGKGYARILLDSLESILRFNGAKNIYVNSTLNAVNFYKKMGFIEIKQIKNKIGWHDFNCIAMMKIVA